MTKRYALPELGEGLEEAEVVAVLVAEGDEVTEGQSVLELETDKASVEIPAPAAGRVTGVLVAEGDTVSVGQDFVELDAAGAAEEDDEDKEDEAEDEDERAEAAGDEETDEDAESAQDTKPEPSKPSKRSKSAKPSKPSKPSKSSKTDESAESDKHTESSKDTESDEDAESGKAAGSGKAAEDEDGDQPEEAAQSREAEGEDGDTEAPGRDRDQAASRSSRRGAPASRGIDAARRGSRLAPADRGNGASGGGHPAAPSVRRFAREIGLDVDEVPGSGPGGRVSIADVKAHARRTRALHAGARADLPAPPHAAPNGANRDGEPAGESADVEWRPLRGMRRATAEIMTASWTSAPHVTLHAAADVTDLERSRARHAERLAAEDVPLTITAVLVRVLAGALRAFPDANAGLLEAEEQIVVRHRVDVGIAVDTERGLLVPVVRDADRKGIADLAVEVADLARRARERKLAPDDMRGGGATLTNLGGLGVDAFTPILVPGQAVILGVGRMRAMPEWDGDELVRRERLPLSLSFDHRLLDGADGARVLGWIVAALEDPLTLVL